jgi:hypothetical protein
MKKSFFIFCFILAIGNSRVHAEEVESAQLTAYEKLEIANAINTLLKYRVVTFSENAQCVEVKRDLIQELLNEGLIKKESTVLMSICADGSN